jgi:hypothetical protein
MSADANLPYDGREGPGSNQERREIAKKNYDASVQSEARKDPFAKYRTEAGDTEVAQRTGEVQDRSRFGEDRVAGRQTYKNKDGKEMIGNTMQRPDGSTYFVGLPSADQNKADAFNAGTKGGTLNPYNNFEPTPKNYKASADDIRANYAFGAPAGQQGSLMAEAEPDFGRGNRSQLDADTAKFSAGSNYSGIDSRGKQSSSLAGGPAEKPQSQAFSISSPGLPFQQEPKETSQAYKGPEGSQNNNQAQAELKEKSKNLSKKGGERLTFA